MPPKKPLFTGEWYPWYVDAALNSERIDELSLTEYGAYRKALDIQWKRGWMPADPKKFADAVGKKCTVQIACKVMQFFAKVRGSKSRLRNQTLEKVRSEQYANWAANVQRARTAADKRWNKKKLAASSSIAPSNAQAMLTESKREENRIEEKRIEENIYKRREDAKNATAFPAENTLAELAEKPLAATQLDSDLASLDHSNIYTEGTKLFLKNLAQDPQYMHCNIEQEFKKATDWAEKHKVKFNPEFFTGWLDRIHKPPENKEQEHARRIEEVRARVAQRDAALHGPDKTDS